MVSRTIDNLGYDASERYAQDQKMLDGHEKITQDSKVVFTQTSIEVTKPTFHLETDIAFQGALKSNTWAEFSSPVGYESRKRFFTHELIPAFTSAEKTEALKNKVLEMANPEKENPTEEDPDNPSSKKEAWQKAQADEKDEKEKDAIVNLLDCILHLDNCIIYVHSKRAQYHKG